MINTQDQEELFRLIADYLEKDVECLAIGGTAMMFHGYKTTTKDIDLVFKSEQDRGIFIKALLQLGYTERSIRSVYDEKRATDKNKPKMYSRGEERFDLFVMNVFGVDVPFENIVQRHDFIGKKELIVLTLSKELLILLKSVTNREKDYEDIETIVKIEKNIDWKLIVNEALRNRQNKQWMLYDLEEKLQKLKKITFIKKEIFDAIYKSESDYEKKKM
ncbi:MAG: DUF6036 family nucleotidyltransferase [archaeon]